MSAFVCFVSLRLHHNDSASLKGKRKEVSSLKALLRKRFGAAVAEVGGHETWQRAELLCVLAGEADVGERGAELARFAESRHPEGCGVTIEVRSLEDILG